MDRRHFARCALGASVAALGPKSILPATAPGSAAAQVNFSVMAWTLPHHPTFQQQLQIAADAGYGGLELLNEYEHWTTEDWRSNLAAQQRLGIAVDCTVPGRNALADITGRKVLRDDLLRAIPGAQRLGCSRFIYTAYNRMPDQTPQQQRSAIVDTLRYAADILEPANFELLLEPIDRLEHPTEAVTDVAEGCDIIRAVGSPRVRVLYDFYHQQREAGNLIENLEKNIDVVGLVHIADVPGRHHPGTGEINYTNVYRKLAALRYSGVVCMEFLPVADPVAELRQAREEAIRALASA